MGIFHTALSVNSINASRKFYESVFGLKFRVAGERPKQGLKFVMLEDENGMVVELFETNNKLPVDTNFMDFNRLGIKHIAFSVENVDEVFEKALEHGAKVIWEPQKGVTVKRLAFIEDPNGIPVEIAEI